MSMQSKSYKSLRFASQNSQKTSVQSTIEDDTNSTSLIEINRFILPSSEVIRTIFDDTLNMIQMVNKRDYHDHQTDLSKWKYKTLWERFGKPKPFTFDVEFQGSSENMTKLLSDSARVCETLNLIKEELLTSETFKELTDMINGYKQMKKDDEILLNCNEKDRNEILLQEVHWLDKQLKNRDHLVLLEELKNKFIETNARNEVRTMYIETWQNFCNEQLNAIENMKTNAINKEISETEKNIRVENYVHTNIDEFLWETHYDLKKGIDYWTNKYSEDYQDKTTAIIQTKENREELQILMKDLQDAYNKRQKDIDDYLVVREERRLAEELRMQEELERIKQEELERQMQEELEQQRLEEEMQAALQAQVTTDNKGKPKAQVKRKTA